MVLVQKWPFFQLVFLGNILQENVFNDLLERKNAFLGYKNKKFKKSKNWHFSKGVNPSFWSKNGYFSNFFYKQYRPGKCLWWYSRTKKRFCRLQKQEVEEVEKLTVSHGFGLKMAIFPLFFFSQYRPLKCLWLYSRPKKRLFRL